LASEGVNGVRSWTAKKNINIFEKRLIFIPINKTLHWSLCVVVNPGAIIASVDDDDDNDNDNDNEPKDRPLPCMLFFDSLNMHRKTRVHKDIVKWLNSEWKRMKGSDAEPFSKNSCRIYDPPGKNRAEV
jgi:sentrin-specific protease 7